MKLVMAKEGYRKVGDKWLLAKKCTECGRWLVASKANFRKDKKCKYGLGSKCKECMNKKNKQWYEANKEKVAEHHKQWYEANKDKMKEYNKKYYEQNKKAKPKEKPPKHKACTSCGKLLPNTKEYFYEGGKRKDGTKPLKSICKECEKLYHKTQDKIYYQEHKERRKEAHKIWYQNNREKRLEYWQEYRKSERGKQAIVAKRFNDHNRRRVLKQNQGKGITAEQYKEVMSFFDWKCAYSGEKLKKDTRTLDHIIPLKQGGDHEIWNLVPMTRSLNCSKQEKDMLEWYKEQDCYSEARLAKIYEWQEYARKKWKK